MIAAGHDDQADRHEFARLYKPTRYLCDFGATLVPLSDFVKCVPPARCATCGGRFDNLHAERRTCLGCTPKTGEKR